MTTRQVYLSAAHPFSIEAASRNVIRALVAVFTVVVLLLGQSIFWANAVSVPLVIILVAIAGVSYFRPHIGILVLAALTPLGRPLGEVLDTPIRVAEALVLAFLAGALVRGWTLHRFTGFPSNRLHIAALLFGFVVAASCVEQIWLLQIQRDQRWPFLQDLFTYAGRSYVRGVGAYTMMFHAMLLLEGLALLVYCAHNCRTRGGFPQRLVRMLMTGMVAGAALNLVFFANELLDTGAVIANLPQFLTGRRFSAHVSDLNASGSFFAMGLLISAVLAFSNRWKWWPATLILGAALWLTHSRTAMVAVFLVALLLITNIMVSRFALFRRQIRTPLAAAITLGLFGVWWFGAPFVDGNALGAVRLRWMFLQTAIGMVVSWPMFGAGVGQYFQWSTHFSPPELLNYYHAENAHNNFAQVAGELGMLGLTAFLSVLFVSLRPLKERCMKEANGVGPAVVAGVAAFVLTWLGGHPLLVPEVAYSFWVALAIIAGLNKVESQAKWRSVASATLIALILLLSVVFRVEVRANHIVGLKSGSLLFADDRVARRLLSRHNGQT